MYGGRQGFKRKAGSYKSLKRGAKQYSKKRRYSGSSSNGSRFLVPGGNSSLYSHPFGKRPSGGSSGNRSTVYVGRTGNWLPDRLQIPLKWTVNFTFTITSGVGSQAALIANSLLDPGGASASTQPYGYDILVQAYSQYIVRAAGIKIVAQVAMETGSISLANNSVFCALWPTRRTQSYVSDPQGAAQQPHGKSSIFQAASSSQYPFTMCNYMSTAKINGIRGATAIHNGSYSALLTADPTSLWYWAVMVSGSGAGALDTKVNMQVEMIQYTELFDLNDLAST